MSKSSQPSGLRRNHRSLILRGIANQPGMSRVELADSIGLSGMAITRIVRQLLEGGLVEESGKLDRDGVVGRRQTGLQLCSDGAFFLGLVISAFGHSLVLANAHKQIIRSERLNFQDITNISAVMKHIGEAVAEIIEIQGVGRDRVLGIGVAISAIVDGDNRTVLNAPYLNWEHTDLSSILENITGLPVFVENIATALNYAVSTASGETGSANRILIRPAITLGCSIIENGKALRGEHSYAGQIGHLAGMDSNFTCVCGRSDCLNTTASGWSVLARLGMVKFSSIRAEDIESCSQLLTKLMEKNPHKDSSEGKVLWEAGRTLASSIENLCIILDPKTVVLAGPLSYSDAYVTGFKSIWMNSTRRTKPVLEISKISSIQAAVNMAIDSMLLSPNLNFKALVDLTKQSEVIA